jgi:hypothetical protein
MENTAAMLERLYRGVRTSAADGWRHPVETSNCMSRKTILAGGSCGTSVFGHHDQCDLHDTHLLQVFLAGGTSGSTAVDHQPHRPRKVQQQVATKREHVRLCQ